MDGPKRVLQQRVTCLWFVIMSGRAITAEDFNAESLVVSHYSQREIKMNLLHPVLGLTANDLSVDGG